MGTACGRAVVEVTAILTGPWIGWLPAMCISQGLPVCDMQPAFHSKVVCRYRRLGSVAVQRYP